MKDLIKLMNPKYIEVLGKILTSWRYLYSTIYNYGRPDTKYEQLAQTRFVNHDLYSLDKVDNR